MQMTSAVIAYTLCTDFCIFEFWNQQNIECEKWERSVTTTIPSANLTFVELLQPQIKFHSVMPGIKSVPKHYFK